MKTSKQKARQRARTHQGHYETMSTCELCGKHLGSEYCSDLRVDSPGWSSNGLVLCGKCCDKLAAMPDAEAYRLLTGEELKRE